jgi:hypothetical protein
MQQGVIDSLHIVRLDRQLFSGVMLEDPDNTSLQ